MNTKGIILSLSILISMPAIFAYGQAADTEFPSASDGAIPADQKTSIESEFTPSLSISQQYDSNIYRDRTSETDDWLTTLSPHLRTDIDYGIFYAALDLDYTLGRYGDSDDDDFSEYLAATDIRWKPNHRNEFSLAANFNSSHEDRGTGLTENRPFIVSSPIEFHTEQYTGRYQFGSNKSIGRVVFSGIYLDKEYQNFLDLTAARDYDEVTGQAEFYWKLTGRTDFELEVSSKETSYATETPSIDGVPDTLNSKTHLALLGVNLNATGKTGGSILFGYRGRDFEDPDREDFTGPSWRVDVRWAPKEYMRFTMLSSREDRETNGEGSFIDAKIARVGWEADWNSRFNTDLSASLSKNAYQGSQSGRVDSNVSYSLKFQYNMRYWLNMGVTLSHQNNDSGVDTFDFERNLAILYIAINND